MTATDVYKAIQSWAVIVLGSGVSVIQAFQNAPQKALPQVAISLPNAKPVGRSSQPASYTQDSLVATKFNGTLTTDYEGNVSLWETGGDGDLLRKIVESLDSQQALDHFASRGVAVDFPDNEQIIFLPRLEDGAFLKEATTRLNVRWRSTTATSTGKINETIYSGSIEDSANDPYEITFDI